MQIPTIETERLILREFRDSTDFEPYANFYGSDLTKYYGGPLDRSAAEAAIRSRAYAYETLGWDEVFSCISADNIASIRLAEKLGATPEREIEHDTRGKILVFRHS